MKIALVTSAFNEAEGISLFVEKIHKNFQHMLDEGTNLNYELIIANNKSVDQTLLKLKNLKKKYNFLRVFDNRSNLGYDISILNLLNKVDADFYLVMCSDLEDPPELAFSLLKTLINNPSLDSVLAIKRDNEKNLLNIFRTLYYLSTSFSSRTNIMRGFHGFGAYTKETINSALIYANNVNPDARKSLLWASDCYKTFSYKKGKRSGGKSSYSYKSYLFEGLSQLINSPALSSRISIRIAILSTVILILLILFFLVNFFVKVMIFPAGITTLATLILLTSLINYILIALNARQIENLIMPNILSTVKSKEIK